MSEPIELGFRQRVAAAFAEELEGRVFEMVAPPDTKTPYAVYRRTASPTGGRAAEAVIQLTLFDESYAAVKRLQGRIEEYLRGLRSTWLSGNGDDCPVWVYLIRPQTMNDGYQAATRRRAAITEYTIKYKAV